MPRVGADASVKAPGAAVRRVTAAALLCLVACTQDGDGPARVVWDRDVCKACSMVISDRHFAAQVRGGPKNAVAKFDDLGCMMKWLDQQPWADEPATRIWVTRQQDGEWLDGRTARYVSGRTSPMGFNFGAVDPGAEGNDFAAQRAAVRAFATKR
ncbi:MAG: nitrous oxide reductase accessory protein NosL [Myxococcaceae bacterium]|nr:nitrous oxide reductase accessory protein NosL [Myxococcaceae bacterium]